MLDLSRKKCKDLEMDKRDECPFKWMLGFPAGIIWHNKAM